MEQKPSVFKNPVDAYVLVLIKQLSVKYFSGCINYQEANIQFDETAAHSTRELNTTLDNPGFMT